MLDAFEAPTKSAPKVLIIGANGRIAKIVEKRLLAESALDLRLFARNGSRLENLKNSQNLANNQNLKSAQNPEKNQNLASDRVEIIEGDALKKDDLLQAMQGVDIVYANLEGKLGEMASNIIWAMEQAGVKRLIWISSLGVYGEVNAYELAKVSPWLGEHKKSVALIERSSIDYTIIRPGWLSNTDIIDYGLTQKEQDFINPQQYVSRASVADLIVKICLNPSLYNRASLGIHALESKK
ncbi:hypothetical protein BKN38_08105 [Helicobacter sp. CLO-3]|nr:hypothetical protein BA723_08020 [Helicobacter sp. CLO-3]OHU81870.1 hypothetical protein BKN38_08105 [Helicobacter sp. CLO-3]